MVVFSLYINQATYTCKVKYKKSAAALLYHGDTLQKYLMLLESREKYLMKNYHFMQDFFDIVCTF